MGNWMQETLFDLSPDWAEGVPQEVIDAIEAPVSAEMVSVLAAYLGPVPKPVEKVRRYMRQFGWFPSQTKPDTQRRRLRVIMDAANEAGLPLGSLSSGYFNNAALLMESAKRAERFGHGCLARAARLAALAQALNGQGKVA